MTVHLKTRVLEKYALGRVVEPELTRVEEHLLQCQECIDRAEALKRFIARMGASATLDDSDVNRH